MTQDERLNYFINLIKEILPCSNVKAVINRDELALVLSVSRATIDRRIKSGYGIPKYIKGAKAKSRVYFTILDTAEFLATQSVKIA